MHNLLILTFSAAALIAALSGCGNSVPQISDPRNIVVDGEKMSPTQFAERYCQGIASNTSCDLVRQAMQEDAAKSKDGPPRF